MDKHQKKIVVLTLSAEIYVYGLLALFAVRNVWEFLIKQKYYTNPHLMAFYLLIFVIFAGRIIQFSNLASYYNFDGGVKNINKNHPPKPNKQYFSILPIQVAGNTANFAKILLGFA